MTVQLILDGLAWTCVFMAVYSLFRNNVHDSDSLSWLVLAALFHWWLR